MEITKEWIDQQRAVCEEVKREGAFTLPAAEKMFMSDMPAALDALEASMQREAEKDAEIVRMTAERDAAVKDFKASIETDHCQYCKNMEKCEQKAEREQTYAYPFKGCGFNWVGLRTKDAPTGAESAENAQEGTTDVEHTTD